MSMPPRSSSRRGEQGVALVAALIVLVLVVGVISIFSVLAVGDSQRGRTDRQRAESLYWVEQASAQVLTQLRAHQIGPHAAAGVAGRTEFWRVPGAAGRRALTVTTPDGRTQQGWYEILAPQRGAPANTVAWNADPADLEHRGEVVLVLRGAVTANDPSPRAARVVFRRSSLARYAIVSDAPIDVGNLGTPQVRGSVHSNNVSNASVGIRLANAATSGATRISTTQGSISGSCQARECVPRSEKAVSFTNIDRAFAEVERLATRGGCTAGIACVVTSAMNWHPAGSSPAYRVRLDGPACGSGSRAVTAERIALPLRVDARAASIVDDTRQPVGSYGSAGSWCPSRGGMALLFNGDVQVEGVRSGPPVTIMARNSAFPRTVVHGGTTTRQQPGSIFVVSRGSGVGSSDALRPVGLIAEGSVYLPDWAIGTGQNRTLSIQHAAIAAKEGELSLGPMTMAMAGSLEGLSGSGSNERAGGGLNPCATEANAFDGGGRLTIVGAVASRREPVLGYGTTAACSFGYSNRTYQYSDTLEWNPPPLYPTESPWHVAEWDELAADGAAGGP